MAQVVAFEIDELYVLLRYLILLPLLLPQAAERVIIAFEFPSAILLLSMLGVIDKELLKRGRKYAFVVLLIVAAFITPSGDPLSMLLLAAPLYLLYEMSISLCSSRTKP